MSFLKRLFSSDLKAAKRAEAAGDFELAAQRYALAEDYAQAVAMHMARAERASSRTAEIEALRDALHWSREDRELKRSSAKALGKALIAQAKAEGVHTPRDKERLQQAAELLQESGAFSLAGDIFVQLEDHRRAAAAYREGGMVAKLEHSLSSQSDKADRNRLQRQNFADYELHMSGGSRDAAIEALQNALEYADDKRNHRQVLLDLQSRLIESGHLHLRMGGESYRFSCQEEVYLGRDEACALPLRGSGISRRHAGIRQEESGFVLFDAGSKNGTLLEMMPLRGEFTLVDSGSFQLGDATHLHYSVHPSSSLQLEITMGLDKGHQLWLARPSASLPLPSPEASLRFLHGRPLVKAEGHSVILNNEKIAVGEIQLIQGDLFTIDGDEYEVL